MWLKRSFPGVAGGGVAVGIKKFPLYFLVANPEPQPTQVQHELMRGLRAVSAVGSAWAGVGA